MPRLQSLAAFLLLPFTGLAAEPPQVPADCTLETVCDRLDAPITMDVAHDGRVFITEQFGNIRVVQDGKLLPDPFVKIEVDDTWERGVVGVALHPKFPEEPYVYVHYDRKAPYPCHVVSRFTAESPSFNTAKAGSELVMIEGEDQSLKFNKYKGAHQGGAMRFGADGKLYVTIGEHNLRDPAQDLGSLFGKLLRFNADGSIPSDNPFATKLEGKFRAIYAYGLRNPFGLAVQPGTGRMFIDDVGQDLFEEINEAKPGANYGWPIAEGMLGNKPEFEKPFFFYNRSIGPCIAGGVFVPEKDAALPEALGGKYVFEDFSTGKLLVLDPAKPEKCDLFATRFPSPTDLGIAPDGSLLVLARNTYVHDDNLKHNTGQLLRIRKK